MRRRRILAGLVLTLAAPLAGEAQLRHNVPRIGVVAPTSPPPSPSPDIDGFRHGLRELGYVEGQTIIVEYRWAAGRPDRWAPLIAELAGLGVDVVVVAGTGVAAAAKGVTSRIPIVMATGGADPVAAGLAESLARPGGNVTGLSMMVVELSAKRVELLKAAIPGLSRIAVLVPPGNPGGYDQYDLPLKEMEAAARAVGVQIHPVRVAGSAGLDAAFRAATKERAGAVITMQSPFFGNEVVRIARLALQHRLASIAGEPGFTDAGGLITYGPSIPDLWRRAALYVDKILKGAAAAQLPIEQPTKFELAINLKTAKALGLAIPPSMLLRADRIIE